MSTLEEEIKNITGEVDITLLHSSEADSVEAIIDVAIYGLAAMTGKYNKTPNEKAVMQVIAGHISKLLDTLPKNDSLVKN